MDLKKKIREIPDWPVAGVNFKDITTLLEDGEIFRQVVDQLAQPFGKVKIDKVVGIDARGFALAAPVAYKLHAGLCLIRKKGKLPYKTIEESYEKEYGPDTLAIHRDTIKKGERVAIIDDLLATGGTMLAAVKLIERLGGKIVGISYIIDLPFLGGSRKLKKYKRYHLVSYETE
jgi:adenine phosphoribosyltransferase